MQHCGMSFAAAASTEISPMHLSDEEEARWTRIPAEWCVALGLGVVVSQQTSKAARVGVYHEGRLPAG